MSKPLSQNQKTFNKVYRGLMKQGTKSLKHINENDDISEITCAYRGVNGNKCAVGLLIPDSEYVPAMEKNLCYDGLVKENLEKHGHNPYFARRLQIIHDHSDVWHWENRLADLADEYNLTIPKVNK